MASWGYVAIDKNGKEIKGSKEADSQEALMRELKNQGLIVLDVTEQNALTKDINISFDTKPKPRDLAVFCRQFASILRAGVSIIEVLNMLAEQTENKMLQKALMEVRADVEKGESFADSLARHPKVFPDLLVQMVKAGESSGSLEISMERMAVQFEKSAKTQALIKKAMIYPIVVALVSVGVVIVMGSCFKHSIPPMSHRKPFSPRPSQRNRQDTKIRPGGRSLQASALFVARRGRRRIVGTENYVSSPTLHF